MHNEKRSNEINQLNQNNSIKNKFNEILKQKENSKKIIKIKILNDFIKKIII